MWIKWMIATVSVTSLASGTVLACMAERFPERIARIETAAGLLIVFGLLCVGVGLSIYLP